MGSATAMDRGMREGSLAETRKRLSYALPMMDLLYQAAGAARESGLQ